MDTELSSIPVAWIDNSKRCPNPLTEIQRIHESILEKWTKRSFQKLNVNFENQIHPSTLFNGMKDVLRKHRIVS